MRIASAKGKTPQEAKKKVQSTMEKSEDFGKPMPKREGESTNEHVGRIISHLMKDKGYDQKRAIAAAYSMAGHPRAGKPVKKSLRLFVSV